MDQYSPHMSPERRREPAPPIPVFTDPTGQRRRLMVLFAAGASVLLVGVLIMVGIGIFGGPQSPLSVFGPQPGQHHSPGQHSAGGGKNGSQAPGAAGPTSSGYPTPSPDPSARAPSPSASATPSPTKTPPANGHTKSPPPHPSPSPSPSSTHAR